MANEHIFSDNEEVLKLFSDEAQKSWIENPDALVYLSELSSVGLHRLHQEPDRLAEEKASLLEQTQDLAFHNYKTFIQTAECSHEIFQDFNVIENRLDAMLKKLPEFSEKCQDFGKHALSINARWHEASLTLKKHPQLLEFLEMPQLMDTYVRNALYEEALELASYIKRLDRKHSNIPLIVGIVKSVQETLNVMLSQLLAQLQSSIQLPSCLKVIGYLRRMDVFSELELRIKFLQARGSWFQEIINKISKESPYQHIIKVIETSRVHLFDIITQYHAIFSDDDPVLLTTRDSGQSETAVFQSWIALKIMDFLDILQSDLEYDLGNKTDSVFAQCMYFGLSFSRVGIDFRPLVVPIFEQVMLLKFRSSVEEAALIFEKTMQMYTITNYSVTTSAVMSTSQISGDSLQPPNSLLDYHPLAQYCNTVLNAFNDLKLCSSFSIAAEVVSSLQKSLSYVVDVMLDFELRERPTMLDNERELYIKFCLQFAEELVPHFEKCLDVIFPKDELASILGVTLLEFGKLQKNFSLNTSSILKPLVEILPPKGDDDGSDYDDEDVGLMLTVKPEPSVDDSETNEVSQATE